MMAAEARGTHRLWDPSPPVLDDPFALALVGPGWEELAAETRAMARHEVTRAGRAGVVVRTRYAEDRLADGGPFAQYVILGAGLDSFAWRRPDLLRTLRVFEVDHPATQAWKQERMATLGLPLDPAHVFVPVDFETGTLHDALDGAGLDWSGPTLFSCVGVAMYLEGGALDATLRTVARAASGSEIVLGYNVADGFLDDIGREFLAAVRARVAGTGEPLRTSMAPEEAEALLTDCGLTVVDHPTSDDLAGRYGVRPYTLERLLTARVPESGFIVG